jgi:hypothetical protein
MIIRQIKPSDHDALKALQAKSASKYDSEGFDFESKNFIHGFVAVDDEDNPRMLLCFRRTAEAHVVIDHEFDTPGFRLVCLRELIEAAKPVMVNLGYDDVFGTVAPDVPHGYLKRLKAFGCGVLENWSLVKMWKGQS